MSNNEQEIKSNILRKQIQIQLIIRGYNKKELAALMHMSLASLYNKLNNPESFTLKEIRMLFHHFNFSNEFLLQVI